MAIAVFWPWTGTLMMVVVSKSDEVRSLGEVSLVPWLVGDDRSRRRTHGTRHHRDLNANEAEEAERTR